MTSLEEQTTAAHAAPDGGPRGDAAAAAANPALVGVPTFVIGSVALGLYLVAFTGSSDNAALGMLPILFACTAVGQWVACIWAIRERQGPVAAIFATFGGFWFSFAILATGLGHGWFGDATQTAAQAAAKETFLLSWLVGIIILTIAGLRLPLAFTTIFVLVDVALLLVLLGTALSSTLLLAIGGIVVWLFALVGAYVFIGVVGEATGGKAPSLGKPVVSS